MFGAESVCMFTTRFRAVLVAPVLVAGAAFGAGCGGSSGHQATSTTTTAPAAVSTSTKPVHPKPKATTSSTAGAPHGSTATTVPAADLAALKQQLDEAGSSLGAAGTALAQSDPNQTKGSEGTTP